LKFLFERFIASMVTTKIKLY